MPYQQKRYLELDALRGIAALFVMFFHLTLGKGQWWGFNLGVSGVDLFFLISGFVIFMSINKVSSGSEFVINRVARLYPTYWTCVSITFGVIVLLRLLHFKLNHDRGADVHDYLINLTMFQYYLGVKNLDVPYWTLIVEMLFYLFILLLYSIKQLKNIVTIGCIINLLIIINYWAVAQGYISNYTSYIPLFNHFALFFGGIIFYLLATASIDRVIYGYLLIAFCFLTQCFIYKFAGSNPAHISQWQYVYMLLIYFTLFVAFINDKLKFIVNKPVLFLGKISFALYLLHNLIFRGVIGFLEKRHLPFWGALILVATMVFVLSWLITVYIEQPGGKRLKAFLRKQFLST